MENITDVDYTHTKRVGEDFEMKTSGEYHDLLADAFGDFQNLYLKMYELDPAYFLLIWQYLGKEH